MSVYNIVWADDDIEDLLELYSKRFESHGIKIVGTAHDGEELTKVLLELAKLSKVDAVVVDANFNSSDTGVESERDTSGLDKANTLNQHYQMLNQSIPFFIFSARSEELLRDIYYYDRKFFSEVYPRHKRWFMKGFEEFEDMVNAIKEAVDENKSTAFVVRNKYSNVFSWLPDKLYDEVFSLLLIIETGEVQNTDVFNKIRKILDWTMRTLNSYGILGVEFNGSNLTECSKFLSCADLQKYVPMYIQRVIFSCTSIANEGSHRLRIDDDVRAGNAPYLVVSTIFELLDILMWYHLLPTDEESKNEIKKVVSDIVASLNEIDNSQEPQFDEELKVWHCDDVMLPFSSWYGGRLILKDISPNTSESQPIKERYPYFAKFERVTKK